MSGATPCSVTQHILWDNFKLEIKKTAVKRSIQLSKIKETNSNRSREEITDCRLKLEGEPLNRQALDKLSRLMKSLEALEKEKREGQRIRSKQQEILKGERSTKYYLKKEKERGEDKQIKVLLNDSNEIIEQKDKILNETEKFYTALYYSNGNNKEQMEDNLKHIKYKINKDEQKQLNEWISEPEIQNAIKEMASEKSPGDDGLPKEFYQKFKDILIPELCEIYNNIILSGKQPESPKNAIIKLIFKKGDHRKLKNWRPVSLLNVDYKILSKIMASRLRHKLENIIHKEQKCGIPNRKMIKIIRNLSSYRDEAFSGYFVQIDQEKGFDRLNHDYVFKTMETLGITENFLKLTKTLYAENTSQVMINGCLTNKINIQRGVRQGCPLSMILYTIGTTPLLEMIKDEKEITGHITKNIKPIKLQSYADDMTVKTNHPNELNALNKVLKKHSEASEAKINEDKTQIFVIGRRNKHETDFQKLVTNKIKILGNWFCSEKSKETYENLKKANLTIDSFKEKTKHLSLIGKIININTYVYSQIWHAAWLIDTNCKEFNSFERKIASYFQLTKAMDVYEHVSKKKLEGGLNLINVKERIIAIKTKLIIEAIEQKSETDNIIYQLSTYAEKIYDKKITGPKKEIVGDKMKQITDKIIKYLKNLKNFKKRHKREMKSKDYQHIMFPKLIKDSHNNHLKAIEPKLISLNYLIVHKLLPFKDEKCPLCKINTETIDHLLFECHKTITIRQTLATFLTAAGTENQTKRNIKEMNEINNVLEIQIISYFKYAIWTYRNIARFTNINYEAINKKFHKDINFYIQHIYSAN